MFDTAELGHFIEEIVCIYVSLVHDCFDVCIAVADFLCRRFFTGAYHYYDDLFILYSIMVHSVALLQSGSPVLLMMGDYADVVLVLISIIIVNCVACDQEMSTYEYLVSKGASPAPVTCDPNIVG